MEEELKSISFELGEEKEEMEKQLYKASTATESLNVAEAKVAELEKVVEDLKFEVEEDEKQRDMVDTLTRKAGKIILEEEERKKGGRQKVKRRKGIKEICRNLTVSGSSGASSFRQKNSINGIKQERC